MKIKVAELEGAELDAWVARAEGREPYIEDYDKYGCQCWIRGSDYNPDSPYSPSSDWSQGGSIIEREKIMINPLGEDEDGKDWGWGSSIETTEATYQNGPTPLIAAMRCFVSSKFGEEVEEA